jgi:hypothetical protein
LFIKEATPETVEQGTIISYHAAEVQDGQTCPIQ